VTGAERLNLERGARRLLAIFVTLSLAWPRSSLFFPLLYTAVGVIFIFAARHGTAKPGKELPLEFLGWL
jgi:hypothetical protein